MNASKNAGIITSGCSNSDPVLAVTSSTRITSFPGFMASCPKIQIFVLFFVQFAPAPRQACANPHITTFTTHTAQLHTMHALP